MNTILIRRLFIVFWIFISIADIQAQKHPYLFFTKERLDILKIRIEKDTVISTNWRLILQEANSILEKEKVDDKIDFLSLAYLVTKDHRYGEKIKSELLKLCSQQTWSSAEMISRTPPWYSDLQTSKKCWIVSLGYDAIYNMLTIEERKTIVDGLVQKGIKPALNEWLFSDTRIHTLNSMGHNWWSACVGSAGVASLAIMADYPEAKKWAEQVSEGLEEWFQFNGDDLQNKPKTIDSKGGMYESVNYSAFGSGEYFFFRLACTNALPGYKQPSSPIFENYSQWFMHVCYPRSGPLYSLNFGDGSIFAVGDRTVKLLYALGYKNPNNLWYLNQIQNLQHPESMSINTPIGLVYEPDMSKAPSLPDLPKSVLFEDMDWATMRNSWEKDATMLGVKCGYTWNHSHADANSFILFHNGEDIIKDAGNSWYGSKEYSQYFFQSEAHNIVMFNGKAQSREQQYCGSPLRGELSHLLDAGNFKYLQANATGPTSEYFARNYRHIIWIGKVILIIDDVKAYETGKFEWLLHPGGDSKKIDGDISIVKNKASVLVRPLFPETLVQTGFEHDFPEKLKLTEITAPKARDPLKTTEKYYSIAIPDVVKQTKFITAIILKDSLNDINLPRIERLHNEEMRGVRIIQDGTITEIYLNLLADGHVMHLNSCITINEWDTDAYLFGFSYPESKKQSYANDLTQVFVAYGSYLRQNNKTVFSSLSKLYMITSYENSLLKIEINGQPLIHAYIQPIIKPEKLILNGNMVTPEYQEGKLVILNNPKSKLKF